LRRGELPGFALSGEDDRPGLRQRILALSLSSPGRAAAVHAAALRGL